MDEVDQRHKQEFEKVCDEKFLGSDVSTGSKTIGRENGEMIVKFLKDPDSDISGGR